MARVVTSVPDRSRRDALKIAAGATILPLGLPSAVQAREQSDNVHGQGRNQLFDQGWRFAKDLPQGAEHPEYDDGAWREVALPHDWSIEDLPARPGRIGPFDREAEGGASNGYVIGGEGWYRKRFRLTGAGTDGGAEILFDGAYMVADVWLNGHHLGNHVHGYTPFTFDLTPHLQDGENLIAVRVRNLGQNSRWYSGSGLYRPVTLDVFARTSRIARWGVGAWTRKITATAAEIDVTTRLDNVAPGLELRTSLLDPDGKVAAVRTDAGAATVSQTLALKSPALWSPATPNLYRLQSQLLDRGRVIDEVIEPFGVRIVTFDADQGMSINGLPTKLRGGCVHHDNGILGARAYPDAEERRIVQLKQRGFNAIRSSHNPPSRAFRQACDKHGMLLIVEAYDMWHAPNKPDDHSQFFAERWQGELAEMVLSARNSPSVIMWSIGNEIAERGTREGMRWSWRLGNEVRRLDPTRPVTAGIHSFVGRSVVAGEQTARQGFAGKVDETSSIFLDVVGYNYMLSDLDTIHAERPERIIYASETFARDVFGYADLMKRAPWFVGEFVWTAMDYLGEVGIGATVRFPPDEPVPLGSAFPWINSFCGDIDLIGQQKPQSLARDVAWGISVLEMLVQRPLPKGWIEQTMPWGWADELPAWTWPGLEGQSLTVRIYTVADEVELALNGKVLDRKAVPDPSKMSVEFAVPYASGTLVATAFRDGKAIGERILETTGPAAQLRLRAEKSIGNRAANGLNYVGIEVLDQQGRLVLDGETDVKLHINGPAELIAFGSAGPFASSFSSNVRRSWRGRALAVLRSTGAGGVVRLEASASGLRGAAGTIRLV